MIAFSRARAGAIRPALSLALALALSGAAGSPVLAGDKDTRMVERRYDPAAVVELVGRANVQATIRFGENERIENVAIGDSSAWQVTPNKRANLLFVKPLGDMSQTNMTVVTNRRTYLFDLVADPGGQPVYILSFTYPDEPKAALAQGDNGDAVAARLASGDLEAAVDPAALNFRWKAKGDRKLLPQQTYDDGQMTFLAWSADRPMPAILVEDGEKNEGAVNFTMRGDTIVVDGVPARLILRHGKDRAVLTRTAPAAPKPQTPAPGQTAGTGALAHNAETK